MTALTTKQLKSYNDNGYIAPVDALSLQEVKKIKTEIEYIEIKWPDGHFGYNPLNPRLDLY